MKTVIIADLHLSQRFNEPLFNALVGVISDADTVVINGDFWDGHLCTFDEFINSKWNKLFPFLKEKEAFYLFGNHDREVYSDDRRDAFSAGSGHEIDLKGSNGLIHVEHGDRIAPYIDSRYPRLFNWLTKFRIWRLYSRLVGYLTPDFINQLQRDKKIKEYLANSKGVFEGRGYISVVLSHVHRQTYLSEVGVYVTGAKGKGFVDYVEVEDGEVGLLRFSYC